MPKMGEKAKSRCGPCGDGNVDEHMRNGHQEGQVKRARKVEAARGIHAKREHQAPEPGVVSERIAADEIAPGFQRREERDPLGAGSPEK
jgi:hypothetical protein